MQKNHLWYLCLLYLIILDLPDITEMLILYRDLSCAHLTIAHHFFVFVSIDVVEKWNCVLNEIISVVSPQVFKKRLKAFILTTIFLLLIYSLPFIVLHCLCCFLLFGGPL